MSSRCAHIDEDGVTVKNLIVISPEVAARMGYDVVELERDTRVEVGWVLVDRKQKLFDEPPGRFEAEKDALLKVVEAEKARLVLEQLRVAAITDDSLRDRIAAATTRDELEAVKVAVTKPGEIDEVTIEVTLSADAKR